MRPALLLLALLCAAPARSEGLDLTQAERAAFRAEVRAAILADPEPIERALTPPAADLYSENVAEDRARLEANMTLFDRTERGFGAENPRLTLVFFESYPCADCAAAWAELEALMARHDDIRVEPRFAAESGVAQLLLSLLDREGAEAYRAARAKLMAATTGEELARVLDEGRWIQDRMLRPAPRLEAEAFQALELESAPALVLPDMMLQGSIPAIVLEKYVAE